MDATILIPVKNGMPFLENALRSCLFLKCRYEYEIVVVNDHSNDLSEDVLREFSQKYTNFSYANNHKDGISNALNTGLQLARGKYIIRFDADDILVPARIESQLDFLTSNPDYVAVGGQITLLSDRPLNFRETFYPTDKDLSFALSKGCLMAHPTVTFVKDPVLEIGGYRAKFDGAEDYDLWLRLSSIGKLTNLDEVCVQYRVHDNQFTSAHKLKSLSATTLVRLYWILGFTQFHLRKSQRDAILKPHFRVPRLRMFFHLLKDIYFYLKMMFSKWTMISCRPNP